MGLDEYFSTGPAHERPVFEAVMARLADVGPVHVEPVSVGIFLKRARTFAELRPRDRWVALSFTLPRRVSHRCLVRKVRPHAGGHLHVLDLTGPADVDDDVAGWLVEAYLASPP
jgi:hypothetical protein